MEFTKEQKKILRSLTKAEKENGPCPFTNNRQPLQELIQKAWEAHEEEYWRLWTIFYLRISLLTKTTNIRAKILDALDAPLYLEREMETHDYLHVFN